MYCENCGHKLNANDLFCEECGTKTNKSTEIVSQNSNKTIWIILGSIFGGIFLLIVLAIIFFGILVADYNSIDNIVDYDIEEEYDYRNDNDDIIQSIDSF